MPAHTPKKRKANVRKAERAGKTPRQARRIARGKARRAR